MAQHGPTWPNMANQSNFEDIMNDLWLLMHAANWQEAEEKVDDISGRLQMRGACFGGTTPLWGALGLQGLERHYSACIEFRYKRFTHL
ncbi:hypothetical protein N7456_000801 [Penicillium angulare]|uniref:Uncharacterized protein n=1 Tax=Penicillium angulare TaxID=116970 RepID=A0A9W9GE56_9EURO|nr:hypothetical protein N7456_000801 [Penicillium angulare]